MNNHERLNISWLAPVLPSRSLAGIPLEMPLDDFESALESYVLDRELSLYKFEDSPVLKGRKGLDKAGNGILTFSVYDKELTNWRQFYDSSNHAGANPRALTVFLEWEIYMPYGLGCLRSIKKVVDLITPMLENYRVE